MATTHLIALMIPGPSMAMVFNASVNNGKDAALLTGWGLSLAVIIQVLLVFWGVTSLFSTIPYFYESITVIGALYILFLGVQLFSISLTERRISTEKVCAGNEAFFKKGFLLGFINPEAILFIFGLMTVFIRQDTHSMVSGIYVIHICLVSFIWFTVSAIFFEKIKNVFMRCQKLFNLVIGSLFVFKASSVLFSQLTKM